MAEGGHVKSKLESRKWQSTMIHFPLATCQVQLTTCQVQLTTCQVQLTTCQVQLTTCHLQLTTCHLQLTTYHLQLATYHLQLATFDTTPSPITLKAEKERVLVYSRGRLGTKNDSTSWYHTTSAHTWWRKFSVPTKVVTQIAQLWMSNFGPLWVSYKKTSKIFLSLIRCVAFQCGKQFILVK